MEFSRDLRADVLSGRITVTFRLWRRPKVKTGGRYRIEFHALDSVRSRLRRAE